MKKLPFLAALSIALLIGGILAGVAHARGTLYASGYEIQLNDRATPLVTAPAAGAYLPLTNVNKLRLTVCSCTTSSCATQGGNLTGGTMQCWYYSPRLGWVINPDLALAIGTPAQPCRTWGDIASPGGNLGGSAICTAVGVTTVSGTHIQAHLEGVANE